jgi:hypothetical protein
VLCIEQQSYFWTGFICVDGSSWRTCPCSHAAGLEAKTCLGGRYQCVACVSRGEQFMWEWALA